MVEFVNAPMKAFSYSQWVSHFAGNDKRRLQIDFSQEKGLSDAERRLIFPSIRAFQKGEGSDGAYLMQTVERYVQKGGEAAYAEAMRWFIKEENWHSAYLKSFMRFYQVAGAKRSFLDKVFRRLRKCGGLKCEVTILVTAEMIALTYYDALASCTDSPALKSVCRQMLEDEVPHILFQSCTLRRLKRRRTDPLVRRAVMDITALAVWLAFHKVFQTGGYGFGRFWRENRGYLQQSVRLVQGG
ncbi:MAG: hypothetical protein HFE86_03290 [Clostridiales bacterium]|nr:hypothetical protein [Clostridiales bacterium]